MSDASQQEFSFIEESTYGQIPNSAFTAVKVTGGSFGSTPTLTRSSQIRSDGQRDVSQQTDVASSPSLDIEMQTEAFDSLIKGALRSTWSSDAAVSSSDIQADNANSQFKVPSGSSLDFTTENLTDEQFINVQGFDTSGANGWFRIKSIAADTVTVEPAPADDTNSASNTITMKGSYMRNGTTDTSYTLQKQNKDLTNWYRYITGCRVNTWSLTLAPGSLITGSFGFEGQLEDTDTSAQGNGTVNSAPDKTPFNAVDNVKLIALDGSSTSIELTEISFEANQNARRNNAVGTLGAVDIGVGPVDVTGTLTMYLDDNSKTQLDKLHDATSQSFAVAFDINNVGYCIDFMKIKFSDEGGNIPGNGEEETYSFNFQAEPGDDLGKTIQVTRVLSSF